MAIRERAPETNREVPSLLQRSFPQVVLLMAAGAFALTLAELLLMGHNEKGQIVGLVTTALGMLLSLAGVAASGVWRKVVVGLLALVALEGLAGTAFHRFGDPAERHEAASAVSQPPKETHDEHAPPLAPLSVTGLALLAAAAIGAKPQRP